MSGYVVVESNVLNPEKLAEYAKLAAPTVVEFGGKFIAKGAVEVLHGPKPFANKAVIEFPSNEQAKQWYESEAYQALASLREEAMESQFQIVSAIG